MALKAFGKRVTVERAAAPDKVGSIIVPDAKRPLKGTITSVSDEVSTLKAGDTVYYGAYAGTEIEVDGKKVLVLGLDDILATE